MSQSDTRQRYANKNANQSRPSRPNWGSEARDFRPVGQRYGSVLVLSGPKRKQAATGPAARKPIPRPVNLPSQRKDRHAEGSLLGSKQGRPEDSSQQVESTTHSLNSQSWQNSNAGTWNPPQEATSRTDEYGFPIRTEAPINAREFPTLAASKQSGPPNKLRPQHDQADAYFSLDDRDTLPPPEPKLAEDCGFGSQREEHRPGTREDWRNSTGRPGGLGGGDRLAGGGDSRDGRPFRDDVESRLFTNNRQQQSDSRRGAFGFHTQDQDRSRSGGAPNGAPRPGGRLSDGGGGGAFGPSAGHSMSRDGRTGSRIEEYGLRPGDHSSRGGSKQHQEDYLGPAAQMRGTVDVFSSTLLAAGVAPPVSSGVPVTAAMKTAAAEPSDSEEDEELVAHYKELELIKAEEEEKDRQRALAAEAAGIEASGAGSGEEEGGEDGGDTWEDAVEGEVGAVGAEGDDALGLKPVDTTKWQQRQAEIEAEDRLRRERAEEKKRALEEAIARREEDKARAAREASQAALAALAAASQPLPATAVQVVVPPPPPPPRTGAPGAPLVHGQFPVRAPPPPPEAVHDEEPAACAVAVPRSVEQSSSTLETLPAIGDTAAIAAQQQQRRADFVPAPAPAKPAWGQALYARADVSQKFPVDPSVGAAAAAAPPLKHNLADVRQQNVNSQQEPWNSHGSMEPSSYWRDDNPPDPHRQRGPPQSHAGAEGGSSGPRGGRYTSGHRDETSQGRGRGRRARGDGRIDGRSGGRGRHMPGDGHPHATTAPPPPPSAPVSTTPPTATVHSTSSSVAATGTPPPAAPSVSASSNAASDADAAALAAAAKAAKAMESIMLPTLMVPVSRKTPVDILPTNNVTAAPTSHSHSHPATPQTIQDVSPSKAPAASPLRTEGSVVGPPQPQHSAPAVYESRYGSTSDLGLPSSNSVPALDTDEKHAGMFDGVDMGENLLPSNILGIDDAPYPTSKPSHSDPVPSTNPQLLPMLESSFSPSLDQNKTLSPIAHARPFTRSDHGAPLGTTPSYPGHSQPPPPAHNVRDRLPDQAQLWGLPGREWDGHSQQQQPPLHPPSGDLHLHAGGFGSGSVASQGAYNTPSKPPQHSTAPGAPPVGVSSAPPVFHNTFGYPSGTVFSMPSFAPNTQLHLPLVPTSKPPDWSNNGHATLGWNAMHPHGNVPQSRPMNVLGPSGSMPQSQDSGSFQMQDAQATHNGYAPGGVPMNAIPGAGSHQHAPQHRMRLSDVEMQLPDNLGLGATPPITHLSLAPPQTSQHMPQQANMHVRSGGGGGSGGGGNRSNNRGGRNGGGPSSHNSGAPHTLGSHNANSQSGSRGGGGGPDGPANPTNSSNNNGRGDRRHGGQSGSDADRNVQSGGGGGRRHGGRGSGRGQGRNHGRRGRGGHASDNTAAASLVSVE